MRAIDWLTAGDVADKEAYLAERRAKAAAKRMVLEKGRRLGKTVDTPSVSTHSSRNNQSQVRVK